MKGQKQFCPFVHRLSSFSILLMAIILILLIAGYGLLYIGIPSKPTNQTIRISVIVFGVLCIIGSIILINKMYFTYTEGRYIDFN
jgi:hypothetical protein